MKVLKFGGTSVGTVESLQNVKKIVEASEEPVIVVVSALGGLTDKLISTARMAAERDDAFLEEYSAICTRHHRIIEALVPVEKQEEVNKSVNQLLDGLKDMYQGIYLIEELSERSLDKVVSFGERLSSTIISNILEGARLFKSPDFIKTLTKYGRSMLDNEVSQKLIHDTFDTADFQIAVVPGFISKDSNGVYTNLGRGGSDYTAAILAAALDARILEIWTDVDGFLTADPRVVKGTKVIPSLSFTEAMELCNFGAKVIYPPTIYPVFHKNIPIYIKNTFNPEAPGTCIFDNKSPEDKSAVRGVSSFRNSCLLSVRIEKGSEEYYENRLLNTLTRNGISVILLNKDRSRRLLIFSLAMTDLSRASDSIEKEFAEELETGELGPVDITTDLATIAIVGDNMKNDTTVVQRLYSVLQENKIDVLASSQGAPKTSVAFVVTSDKEPQALQAVHDSLCIIE